MNKILSSDMVDPYYRNLYHVKPEPVTYSKHKLMLGTAVDTGRTVYLPTKDAWRSIQIGPPGSGKTFFGRAMCDRCIETGRVVVNIQDVKDEFKYSKLPVQAEFAQNLHEGENPKGMPVVALRPTFFKQLEHTKLAKGNHWFSIALDDLEPSDLNTLFNVNKMSEAQKIGMQILIQEVKNQGGIENMQSLLDILDQTDKIDTKVKGNLKNKLQPFMQSHIDETKYQYSIVDIINKGFHPIFNMKEYDNLSQNSAFDYPSMFIGIMLRKLINARRYKKIPPILINFDEVLQVINTTSNNVAKQITIKSVFRDRQDNISFNFVVQDMNQFPSELIKMCRYIFIPGNIQKDDLKIILDKVGKLPSHHTQYTKKLNLWLRKMKQHPFCWMMVDTMSPEEPVVFKPYSPLSHHQKTTV